MKGLEVQVPLLCGKIIISYGRVRSASSSLTWKEKLHRILLWRILVHLCIIRCEGALWSPRGPRIPNTCSHVPFVCKVLNSRNSKQCFSWEIIDECKVPKLDNKYSTLDRKQLLYHHPNKSNIKRRCCMSPHYIIYNCKPTLLKITS